jgi:hypothetical protein
MDWLERDFMEIGKINQEEEWGKMGVMWKNVGEVGDLEFDFIYFNFFIFFEVL